MTSAEPSFIPGQRPLRIAVLTNMIAPYTTQIFERLAAFEHCELVVVYETAMEPNRSWEAPPDLPYRHVILRSVTIDLRRVVPEAFLHVPWRPLHSLSRFSPDVVIAGGGAWTSPTNILAQRARVRCRWAFVPVYESIARAEPSLLQRAAAPLSRRLMGSGDAWIVPGTRAFRRVVELGADPARTFVAPSIPSLPLESVGITSPASRNGKPFTYLCVGRLVEEKGLRYLIEALWHVPEGQLWLAGEGPLRAELEATAPPGRVRFFGHVSWSELQALYRSADALVFPSLHDVWGLVVNEALAHDLPVIASDQVGAVDDLIEEGVNGLVVPVRSAPALARAMREVASWDAHHLARGSALGREKVAWYRPEVAAEIMLRASEAAALHAARRWDSSDR